MAAEMPKRCEQRGCRHAPVAYVSWVKNADKTKGKWLCRKHEMRETRAMRNTETKDMYDE
jgi:hypothetical protein